MGRCVHKNIQKFILFQLTVNVAAVIVNFVADLVMNLSSLFQNHHHTLRCSKKKRLLLLSNGLKILTLQIEFMKPKDTLMIWSLRQGMKYSVLSHK